MGDSPIDFGILEPDENEGYGSWHLPSARDEEIADLVRSLLGGDRTTEGLGRQHAPVLRVFAERMATLARRETSLERLRVGLDALALASSLGDSREALLIMPLLWKSAENLGLDAETEFRISAERAGDGEAIAGFAQRDREDRTIEAMGYVEVEDELGFRYERTW